VGVRFDVKWWIRGYFCWNSYLARVGASGGLTVQVDLWITFGFVSLTEQPSLPRQALSNLCI
jgi:hypothetical protein